MRNRVSAPVPPYFPRKAAAPVIRSTRARESSSNGSGAVRHIARTSVQLTPPGGTFYKFVNGHLVAIPTPKANSISHSHKQK